MRHFVGRSLFEWHPKLHSFIFIINQTTFNIRSSLSRYSIAEFYLYVQKNPRSANNPRLEQHPTPKCPLRYVFLLTQTSSRMPGAFAQRPLVLRSFVTIVFERKSGDETAVKDESDEETRG